VLYRLSYVGGKANREQKTPVHLITPSSSRPKMERVSGIEPPPSAWKAEVLPLNYTRLFSPYLAQIGGGGRIRTYEGNSQQIYSLPPLAAWVPLRGISRLLSFHSGGVSTCARRFRQASAVFFALLCRNVSVRRYRRPLNRLLLGALRSTSEQPIRASVDAHSAQNLRAVRCKVPHARGRLSVSPRTESSNPTRSSTAYNRAPNPEGAVSPI
jgi:hypothetical protein